MHCATPWLFDWKQHTLIFIHTHTHTLPQIFFLNIQNSRDNDGDIRRKKHQQNCSPPPPPPLLFEGGGGRRKKVNTTEKQKKERRLADIELAQWIGVGYRESRPANKSFGRTGYDESYPVGVSSFVWALLHVRTEIRLGMDSAFSAKGQQVKWFISETPVYIHHIREHEWKNIWYDTAVNIKYKGIQQRETNGNKNENKIVRISKTRNNEKPEKDH